MVRSLEMSCPAAELVSQEMESHDEMSQSSQTHLRI